MSDTPIPEDAGGPPPRPLLKPRFVLNLDDETSERLREVSHAERKSKNAITRDALIAYLQGQPT